MSRRLVCVLGLVGLAVFCAPAAVLAQTTDAKSEPAGRKEARALAQRIDAIINKRLAEEKMKAGPKAGDNVIIRRLHVDLEGKIPTLTQVTDFLDNEEDPNRYISRIEELLDSPGFVANWATYYRSIMLAGTNNQQAAQFNGQFEQWLRSRLANNAPYTKLAQEVLVSQNQAGVNPGVFNFVYENKAENLAGATARIFLGIKIECAQCHKHPFAKWTRTQFWEYAAFFTNPQQRIQQPNQPAPQPLPNNRSIRIPETDTVVSAKFITGEEPKWDNNPQPRAVLADWVTSKDNPYFAKAAVDHVWQYFFGVSLVEPIFEPSDDSPPAHPELLEELAKSFIASGYDVKFLIKSILLTDAYQRGSVALNNDSKEQIQMFARMPVRGMMPEQLFDSFVIATANEGEKAIDYNMQQQQQFMQNSPRQIFLAKFTSQDKRIETQTSILQALYLMNGKFLNDRTKLENNKSLETIATQPTSIARKVQTLYLVVLSRQPRQDELTRMVRYVESGGGTGDQRQAIADIYWALLNSSEFLLNH